MIKLSVPDVTAEVVCLCIEALSKKSGSLNYLTKYSSKSSKYAARAVLIGKQLNLFVEENNEIKLTNYCFSILRRVNDNYKLVFKDAILNYKPYILFIDYILNGDSIEESARKVKVVFDLDNDIRTILRAFKNFSRFIELELSQDFLKKNLTKKIEYNHINKITTAISSKFEAQLVISEKLGNECFNYISEPERILLVEAFLKFSDNPANGIDDSAGAFESFLRRIGKDKSIDLTEANGIDEVGQILASKKNKIILGEHRKMCSFFGAFRNPAAHKVHKVMLDHWQINRDASIEIILLILTSIRSIYEYVYNNNLTL